MSFPLVLFHTKLFYFFFSFQFSFPLKDTVDNQDDNHKMTHLKNNVDKYYQERICQIEQKPHLHWLHYCCAGEGGRHREIDGGQHHHAGDVHRDNQVILGVSIDVVGELVDDVDKDGW